jgi:Tesmin/TSO1-like CXC domain, cysteine-rich domain
MNTEQEGNAGESNSANSPSRQQQPRAPPQQYATNKAATPPRYPPSSAPQHPMQHYAPSYYPPYQHPSGSPAPAAMYQPQYGISPSPSVAGNENPNYGYMLAQPLQQQQPYPPHGAGPGQGGSPPSQSSIGGMPMNSPSNAMGQPPPGYPPAGGGPANAGGPGGDQLPLPQHGHPPPPPPQQYPYYSHHQQQPWNYGAGPPPYSGMSPNQPPPPYSVYGGGTPGGGGPAAHDGMPPPQQPYGYNANWHQQPPPPQYYQGWNGMHQHQMPQQHHQISNHPPDHSPPPNVTGEGKTDGSSSNPAEGSSENNGDSANQQQQHQQAAGKRRPISQEMLKSVTSPPEIGTLLLPPKSPSEIQSSQREEIETMGCTCKKTNCLKLYCQCFAIKIYCGNNCRCTDCFNLADYEGKRQDAMTTIMSRNPVAFTAKYKKDKVVDMPAHRLGCKCRKSACLKKVRVVCF